MTTYNYHTLYRPPSPGCQPSNGLIETTDYGTRKKVDEHTAAWGEVTYNRPLTEKEIYDYELRPAETKEKTE